MTTILTQDEVNDISRQSSIKTSLVRLAEAAVLNKMNYTPWEQELNNANMAANAAGAVLKQVREALHLDGTEDLVAAAKDCYTQLGQQARLAARLQHSLDEANKVPSMILAEIRRLLNITSDKADEIIPRVCELITLGHDQLLRANELQQDLVDAHARCLEAIKERDNAHYLKNRLAEMYNQAQASKVKALLQVERLLDGMKSEPIPVAKTDAADTASLETTEGDAVDRRKQACACEHSPLDYGRRAGDRYAPKWPPAQGTKDNGEL